MLVKMIYASHVDIRAILWDVEWIFPILMINAVSIAMKLMDMSMYMTSLVSSYIFSSIQRSWINVRFSFVFTSDVVKNFETVQHPIIR